MSAIRPPHSARSTQPAAAPPAPAAIPSPKVDPRELSELTARIAYELFEQRGYEHGHDVEDWFAAEKAARGRLLSKGA